MKKKRKVYKGKEGRATPKGLEVALPTLTRRGEWSGSRAIGMGYWNGNRGWGGEAAAKKSSEDVIHLRKSADSSLQPWRPSHLTKSFQCKGCGRGDTVIIGEN